MADGRLFHYRFNPADCYAEIDEMSIEERGRFLTKMCRDLVKGESDNCFISGMIEEARKYIETKKLAGKKGGEAKSSSAKAVLSSAIAEPSTPLASSSSSNNSSTETKQKKESKTFSAFIDAGQEFYETKKKRKLTGERLKTFNQFMDAFGDRRGKAEAADSWYDLKLTKPIFDAIMDGAKRYNQEVRPEIIRARGTPKMAQGWLSGRRWEDESMTVDESPKETSRQRLERMVREEESGQKLCA